MEAIETQTITMLGRSQVSARETEPSSALDHIGENDFSNTEVLKQKIKKYEQHIAQQDKLIHRQKKQNDKLKDELKELNSSLTVMIEKTHPGSLKEKKEESEQKRNDVLKKELENSKKQITIYQKEVTQLKAKLEACGVQRVSRLENDLKEKEMKIEQQSAKLKLLEKSEKIYNNTDIGKTNEELTNKVNAMTEEISFLRKKMAEVKKVEEQQGQQLKKRNEYILSLEMKNREASPSKHSTSDKNEKKEPTPQQTDNLKLLQSIEALEYSKAILEKKFKTDLDFMKSRVRSLQDENQDLKLKLANKQKELNIINSRVNELKRKGQNHTLEPIDTNFRRSLDVSQHSLHLFDRRKEIKGLTSMSGTNRKFDDGIIMSIQKPYRIAKMVWTWHQDHILSLTTTYQTTDNSKTSKTIPSFNISHTHKHPSTAQINFDGFEYINDLQALCNKHIECLKITTSRGNVFLVGSDKNQAKCKKLVYDIRTNEKPVAVTGIIDNKKLINGEFSDVLVSFGLEIKKKEVVMGKQPSELSSASRHSFALSHVKKTVKSSAGEKERPEQSINDKNIISEDGN